MPAAMVWPAWASQETRITLALHHLAVGLSLSACWTLHTYKTQELEKKPSRGNFVILPL
jgi:hypothetical protein